MDRERAIEILNNLTFNLDFEDGTSEKDIEDIVDAINMAIEALAMPIVKPKIGYWIEHPEIETSTPEYLMFYECSECGDKQCFCKSDIHKKHFCNNCGAKMVEPQEKRCEDCNHYGKFSLDCGRCDDDCSMYEPQERSDKE